MRCNRVGILPKQEMVIYISILYALPLIIILSLNVYLAYHSINVFIYLILLGSTQELVYIIRYNIKEKIMACSKY